MQKTSNGPDFDPNATGSGSSSLPNLVVEMMDIHPMHLQCTANSLHQFLQDKDEPSQNWNRGPGADPFTAR